LHEKFLDFRINVLEISTEVNIFPRRYVYDLSEVNIFLIATFTSTGYTCRSLLGPRWPDGTLNSRAASLNPRLKELNPTNTSSEPPSTAVVAVPESRFISARISKFFSSPVGTRDHPRRLHKRVPGLPF